MAQKIEVRSTSRAWAARRGCIALGAASPLARASTGATIFGDGFESGSFSAWSPGVTIGCDGTAMVQGGIVAAGLPRPAGPDGRRGFPVLQQGASGSNVPFFRFFTSSGTRLVQKAAKLGSIANSTDVVIGSHPGSDWYKGQLDEASIQIG